MISTSSNSCHPKTGGAGELQSVKKTRWAGLSVSSWAGLRLAGIGLDPFIHANVNLFDFDTHLMTQTFSNIETKLNMWGSGW